MARGSYKLTLRHKLYQKSLSKVHRQGYRFIVLKHIRSNNQIFRIMANKILGVYGEAYNKTPDVRKLYFSEYYINDEVEFLSITI